MIFCRKKTEKLEAFRVGYHAIPEWLKKELDTGCDEVKVFVEAEALKYITMLRANLK